MREVEIDYTETINVVNQIENEWYMEEPTDLELSNNIRGWLDRYQEKPEIIKLGGTSLEHFIRSYRKAYEDIFKQNLSELSKITKFKNGEILSCEKVDLQILKDFHEKKLVLEIGESEFTISSMTKSVFHLGNGILKGIGTYQEILSFLSLITDCEKESNKKLGELFLSFAKSAFEFNEERLFNINIKFKKNGFSSSLIKDYCKKLTHIALLYVFYEPARRIEVVVNDETKNEFTVRKNQESIHAVSMIVALKLLRDGDVGLEELFSPRSEIVFFTREGVNDYLRKSVTKPRKADIHNQLEMQRDALAAEAVSSSTEYKGGFFYRLASKGKIPTAKQLKKYILDPDENNAPESGDKFNNIKTDGITENCVII